MSFLSPGIKNIIKNIFPDRILLHRLPSSEKTSILLTFDDGPDPVITPLIIKLLRTYDCQAIFFVIGEKIQAYPEIFEMIISHGHIIGNHTHTHPNYLITSVSQFRKEILQCDEIIKKYTGQKPKLIRPPLGLTLASLFVSIIQKTKIILWSIEGGEWGIYKQDSTSNIIKRLQENITPRDILLLHDNNSKTLNILDRILPFFKKKGLNLSPDINQLNK